MGKNTLKMNMSGFEKLIVSLSSLDGDVKKAVEESLERAGKIIEEDTIEAVQNSNLPAKGKYSKGDTRQSIVHNPTVHWSGSEASINVGFDYSKKGAGGLLITGTPKMRPDDSLKKIYKSKRYIRDLQKEIYKIMNEHIQKSMGGK